MMVDIDHGRCLSRIDAADMFLGIAARSDTFDFLDLISYLAGSADAAM